MAEGGADELVASDPAEDGFYHAADAQASGAHPARRGAGAVSDIQGRATDTFKRSLDDNGESYFWTHFKALLKKRWRYAIRDRRAMVFQLVIPVRIALPLRFWQLSHSTFSQALALLGGLLLLRVANPGNPPPYVLSTQQFNENNAGVCQGNIIPYAHGNRLSNEGEFICVVIALCGSNAVPCCSC